MASSPSMGSGSNLNGTTISSSTVPPNTGLPAGGSSFKRGRNKNNNLIPYIVIGAVVLLIVIWLLTR